MQSSLSSACLLAALATLAPGVHAQIIPIIVPVGGPCSSQPAKPHFSVKPGPYASPLSVRLRDKTRGAIIFYTTDGWTPTALSPRYLGPIAISATTTLQAVAIVPNCSISSVASAIYTLPGGPPPPPTPPAVVLPALPTSEGTMMLRADAGIPLAFATTVDSRTAQVGDPIAFTLGQDVKIGDANFAPKGTTATGKVIQVDHSGVGGQPGEIQFQVDFLDLNGTQIPLHTTDALSGPNPPAAATSWVTGVLTFGLSILLAHGKDALIPAGTPLTATMSAGTILPAPGGSAPTGPGAGSPAAALSRVPGDPR